MIGQDKTFRFFGEMEANPRSYPLNHRQRGSDICPRTMKLIMFCLTTVSHTTCLFSSQNDPDALGCTEAADNNYIPCEGKSPKSSVALGHASEMVGNTPGTVACTQAISTY